MGDRRIGVLQVLEKSKAFKGKISVFRYRPIATVLRLFSPIHARERGFFGKMESRTTGTAFLLHQVDPCPRLLLIG
jgi:hypothetical protein